MSREQKTGGKEIKKVVGWVSVAVAWVLVGLWSYWGVNEAFHEGWYFESVWQNVVLTLGQYLLIPVILGVVTIVAVKWKKVGVGLLVGFGLFALWFFESNAGRVLIFVPLMILAGGFWWGEIERKKMVVKLTILIPLVIILGWGLPLWWRVEHRFNDGDFGERVVVGNGVALVWAGKGLGFVIEGVDWETAKSNCEALNKKEVFRKSGSLQLTRSAQDDKFGMESLPILSGEGWRLPSREEVVGSLTRKDENAGGEMVGGEARYVVKPDKETPLWNPYSKIIYYWTSDEVDVRRAYLVAYNGRILVRNKTDGAGYFGFRCVKK